MPIAHTAHFFSPYSNYLFTCSVQAMSQLFHSNLLLPFCLSLAFLLPLSVFFAHFIICRHNNIRTLQCEIPNFQWQSMKLLFYKKSCTLMQVIHFHQPLDYTTILNIYPISIQFQFQFKYLPYLYISLNIYVSVFALVSGSNGYSRIVLCNAISKREELLGGAAQGEENYIQS